VASWRLRTPDHLSLMISGKPLNPCCPRSRSHRGAVARASPIAPPLRGHLRLTNGLSVALAPEGTRLRHWTRASVERPRRRPTKLHADKAYDSSALRRALRSRGITPRISRGKIDSSERLGRHRWVVERSRSWLLGFRRLGILYERRAHLLQGLLHLACALICCRFLTVDR
jgi:transposase